MEILSVSDYERDYLRGKCTDGDDIDTLYNSSTIVQIQDVEEIATIQGVLARETPVLNGTCGGTSKDLELHHGEWEFRGVQNHTQRFLTSLDRAFAGFSFSPEQEIMREQELLREFMRKAHLLIDRIPSDDDVLEWLSLMQHYGAPTRLLDFTRSIYVAAFFALYNVTGPESPAIWAINTTWLRERAEKGIKVEEGEKKVKHQVWNFEWWAKDPALFRKYIWYKSHQVVFPVEPFTLNDRLTIQQGCFLCSGDVTKPFHQNLASMLRGKEDSTLKSRVLKIVFPLKTITGKKSVARFLDHNVINKIMLQLSRMNITSATLFPGLEGFAKSVKLHLLVNNSRTKIDNRFPHFGNSPRSISMNDG